MSELFQVVVIFLLAYILFLVLQEEKKRWNANGTFEEYNWKTGDANIRHQKLIEVNQEKGYQPPDEQICVTYQSAEQDGSFSKHILTYQKKSRTKGLVHQENMNHIIPFKQ